MESIKVPRHPLNVKPSGNRILLSPEENAELNAKWSSNLGHLHKLTDEILFEIVGVIRNPQDLKHLGQTSRILYAYTYYDDLWKTLYLSNSNNDSNSISWKGSWRKTVLKIDEEALLQCYPDNLVCSDLLFRPYQCSQIDYKSIFKNIIMEEFKYYQTGKSGNPANYKTIPRVPEESVDLAYFEQNLINTPFILTNNKNSNRWPDWTLSDLLQRFPKINFRQESVNWNLEAYSNYLKENSDESPLYLFDCDSPAMKILTDEYKVPDCFDKDLFKILNDDSRKINCRPNYRWLILGSERTGSTFHKDPNSTCAWNAVLSGCKLWIMMPPNLPPPGVDTSEDEGEVTSPVSLAEYILSGFFKDILKLSRIPENNVFISVVFPGECNYVPNGWWHSVINIEDTVALTQNFVPRPTLSNVIKFFKNKPDQISGFHSNKLVNSLESLIKIMESLDNKDEEFLQRQKKIKDYLNYVKENKISEKKKIKNDILHDKVDDDEEIQRVPLLDTFHELLIENGFNEVWEEAIKYLNKPKNKAVKQNQIWSEIVKEEEQIGGFTFEFTFESDED